MGPADAGIEAIEDAARIAESAFGADSLQAALVRVRLASSMTLLGDYAQSEKLFRSAVPVLEARLGEDHSSTLSALTNLGYLYHRRHDEENAEIIHKAVLERQIAKHGPVHRAVAKSYQNLASAMTQLGRYDESIPLHRKAYEIFRSVLNDDNYVIGFPLLSIAYAELQRDNADAAEAAARECAAPLPRERTRHLPRGRSGLSGRPIARAARKPRRRRQARRGIAMPHACRQHSGPLPDDLSDAGALTHSAPVAERALVLRF